MYEFTGGAACRDGAAGQGDTGGLEGALMDVWRFQWSGNIDKDWASAEKLLLEVSRRTE